MFNQLYSIKIANLLSVITLAQTGKRYYQNTVYLQNAVKTEGEEDDEEGEDSLAAILKMKPAGGETTDQSSLMKQVMGMPGSSGANFDAEWEMQKQSILQQLNREATFQQELLRPKNEDD